MNELAPVWEWLIAIFLLIGAGFALVGSYALACLHDFMKRLHGPTKASTLGVGAVLIASIAYFFLLGEPSFKALLITLFLFLTAPVSAQMLMQAALKLDPSLRPPAPPVSATRADPAAAKPAAVKPAAE